MISSSYRDDKLNANIRIASPMLRSKGAADTTSSSTLKPPFVSRIQINNKNDQTDKDYHDDDEALLDDSSNDFDSNWDNGILRLSAGSGKEIINPKKAKDDVKKTLADQVRDGKYGLIEKELFRRTPKRPGVLSYLPNKEVPEDNSHNYGGLSEDDIWLAEDHLLVIKGGSLNDDNPDEPWPAIDDYAAPKRQIKLAANPKVPPPFPVQLEENGPIQLIGNNKLTVVYPVTNQSLPVYSFASEANNAPAAGDSDDEKNLIARPGTTADAKENNQPPYDYPAPSPPWLYHNQTFVNPSLSGGAAAKPLGFPILGPFLYGKNGSLDNFNGTDDFDEDDPSLYYPPAYSFTYKSNYTNPVPPGPLVPGIVVPPPPDHFSRQEKPEKTERRPLYSTTSSPPARHRPQYSQQLPGTTSTSSTTTTPATTTTTSTSTTSSPFGQVITRISEYTPKVINIVTPAPRPLYAQTPSPPIYSRLPTTSPPAIEPVPVPVAVPIPIYSVGSRPTPQPQSIVSFVPTNSPEQHVDSFSKSNPIYYEYFEAKRQKGASNVIDDFLASTVKPLPSPKPVKLYATSKRPFKSQSQAHHRQNFLAPLAHNHRYAEENIVVITPKPEVRFKPLPVYKQRPLHNFEEEVNAIRQTIRYYQNQELRDNNIPRTPKAKPVYNYGYQESKAVGEHSNQFQAPSEFDVEPFKPMVTYSPSVNDENGFRALAVEKVDAPESKAREELEISLPETQPNYPSSTTLIPIQPPHGRSKKLRVGAKYLQQPANQEFQRQNAWVAVGSSSNANEQNPLPLTRERYQDTLPIQQNSRNRDFQGYHYSSGRQNNRFYEEPFQNSPNRKIVNYRPPPQQQQQQQHLPPAIQWSLENDTYVNYAPNRPPLNPDAEFINPYQTIPLNPYQQQQQQQRLAYQPPALSHQSQYYAPPPPVPQRLPGRQYQSQPPVSLHRDILVNYRQPLPAINPDSEYISHPNVLRSQQPNQLYRTNYRLPPQPLPPLGAVGESDVYYLTPKYRRANNLNPNSSNNQNNNNNNHNHNHNNNNSNNGGK